MKFSIEPRQGYLYAVLAGRDTAEEMREFLLAVHAACREHEMPKILISFRQCRAMFKPEDYGLSGETRAAGRGYAGELVTPACQIAAVGDTEDVNAANEYIEMVARQQGLNVRAFRDEHSALRWLGGAAVPERRYRFARLVIAGAPEDAGIYTLWEYDEIVYYGRADGGSSTIRSRLEEHFRAGMRATHYAWELCRDPAAREAELLGEHERAFGRLPRFNAAAG
jgi:hypothetical protein